MAKIKINGEQLEFEGKRLILDIASEHGIAIPHYCYHPGLSVVASCRICLANVSQPNPRNDNRVELIPKLLPTCQTFAADGMIVDTQTPAAIANQKAVMEFLLINHPLDCPVCDQAGECNLQDYSYKYGRAGSRFEEDKIKQPKKDIGPNVYLYADRCIMCSRCVRFTREVTGTAEIAVVGRGSMEQIDVFPGHPLENELSANVVDLCPVGALLDKDFLFEQRVWFLDKTPSIDGITASGDNIWVEHNQGKIYRIKPRTNLEINKWWISDEIRYGWKFVHSEDRLRTPIRMQYGVQSPTRWGRAYADICDRFRSILKENGPGSVGLMVSPMLPCEEAYLLANLARAIDPESIIAVGPIPTEGADKQFPGGYTVCAEKCPNARGVRRALELVAGDVLGFEGFVESLGDKTSGVAGVMITGNYPSSWPTKELAGAVKRKFVVLIDTLGNSLASAADIVLPGATWVEKAGTFENASGRLQSFQQAIDVLEGARTEGQIAADLLAVYQEAARPIYDAQAVRAEMAGVFADDVAIPTQSDSHEPDLEFVAL